MSKQKDREEFLVIMAREGVPLEVARGVLRDATTLHRLAEAQCNGDYPYNPDPKRVDVRVCRLCDDTIDASATRDMQGNDPTRCLCIACHTEGRINARLAPFNVVAHFQDDPRGCVVKLKVPSGYGNDFGGEGLVCVP